MLKRESLLIDLILSRFDVDENEQCLTQLGSKTIQYIVTEYQYIEHISIIVHQTLALTSIKTKLLSAATNYSFPLIRKPWN